MTPAGHLAAAGGTITNFNIRNDKEHYEMKKTYLAKIAIVSLTMALAFAFTGTPAQAAEATINATMSIATPIAISADSSLVFGTFTAPSSGSPTQKWRVHSVTGDLSVVVAGDGLDLFADDQSRGVFTVVGEPFAAVSYSSVSISNFSDASVRLGGVTFDPQTSIGLDGSGNLTVGVGGVLELDFGAASATHTATITLEVNY